MIENARYVGLDGRGAAFLREQFYAETTFGKEAVAILGREGRPWTWLPEDVSVNRAYSFAEGELIPENAVRRLNRSTSLVSVSSMVPRFIEFVSSSLHDKDIDQCCIIQHPILKPGEEHELLRGRVLYAEDRLYLILTSDCSKDEIHEAIWHSITTWAMLGMFSSEVHNLPGKPAPQTDLESYLRRATCLFSVAYDGEGFVFFDVEQEQRS